MPAGSRTLRHFREPGGVRLLFRQTGPGCAPADQTGEGRGCTEASRGLLRLDSVSTLAGHTKWNTTFTLRKVSE